MKITNILFIFFLLFTGCRNVKSVSGTYSFIYRYSWGHYDFVNGSNKFEYINDGDNNLSGYTEGTWLINKNKLILTGYTDDNIRVLNIDSKITKRELPDNKTKIEINYNSKSQANLFTRFVLINLIVNDKQVIRIYNDTILNLSDNIQRLQIQSYPVRTKGLGVTVAFKMKDTLYSKKIEVGESDSIVKIKFDLDYRDFVRFTYADTFLIKNKNILITSKNIKLHRWRKRNNFIYGEQIK